MQVSICFRCPCFQNIQHPLVGWAAALKHGGPFSHLQIIFITANAFEIDESLFSGKCKHTPKSGLVFIVVEAFSGQVAAPDFCSLVIGFLFCDFAAPPLFCQHFHHFSVVDRWHFCHRGSSCVSQFLLCFGLQGTRLWMKHSPHSINVMNGNGSILSLLSHGVASLVLTPALEALNLLH